MNPFSMNRSSIKHPAATLLLALAPLGTPALFADEPVVETAAQTAAVDSSPDRTAADEATAAAVTINYCRASLHRIRLSPTAGVLGEERRHILNNLNLNGISDEEVIRLYSAVLDEIGSVEIADRERDAAGRHFQRRSAQTATFTAFKLMADVAGLNYTEAVKTGASSWWDFRGLQLDRDAALWKVDRDRMQGVLNKSGEFLDVSWKLARKREIPDRLLVRGDDLDRFAAAVREPDAETRLRRLARLEPYLSAYPPYWYHVGRTQQSRGLFVEAERTYAKLASLGDGHFRRDEMLAAGWANTAMIRDHLGRADAADAAGRALACSTDVWQVNLAAAGVLAKAKRFAEAEDACFRNLDADLESDRSTEALVLVYADGGETDKLVDRLADPAVAARLSPAALVRCAAALRGRSLPDPAAGRLFASLRGTVDARFGRDDLVLSADTAWGLERATFAAAGGDGRAPTLSLEGGRHAVRFPRTAGEADEYAVAVKFGDQAPLRLTFRPARSPLPGTDRALVLARVEAAGSVIAFGEPASTPATRLTARPVSPPPEDERNDAISWGGLFGRDAVR